MELHNLYGNTHKTRMLKSHGLQWAEHVALMRGGRRAHKLFLGNLEGKRPCVGRKLNERIT